MDVGRDRGPAVPPLLSVVAPAFNEELCIETFVEEVGCALADREGDYELICVDDGSTDRTPEILRALRGRFPALRAVALERHQGQSAALAAGIRLARGRVIALLDSDLQNEPRDILRLLPRILDDEQDCVLGVRAVRQDGWLRRISSRIANRMAGWITGHRVRDAGCGIKLCRASLLKAVPFFRGAHRFVPMLVTAAGGRVCEVEVQHRPRRLGQSKYGSGLGRTFVALRDALGVRWLMQRQVNATARDL